jgi:hypothetical protein
MRREDKKWDVRLLLLSVAIAVVTLLMPDTPVATAFCLIALFGVLVKPVLDIPINKDLPTRPQQISSLIILVIFVVLFGLWVWPPSPYLELSRKQRNQFIEKMVIVRCSANEEICTSAAEFIHLFQQAKWVVKGNTVARGFLGRPRRGLSLLVRGEGRIPNPDDPRYGLWSDAVNPERDCLVRAFSRIGIKVNPPMANSALGEDEIALIFGPEP